MKGGKLADLHQYTCFKDIEASIKANVKLPCLQLTVPDDLASPGPGDKEQQKRNLLPHAAPPAGEVNLLA